MSIPKPKRITIEFDDGSKTEEDFDNLTFQLQQELLKQPIFSRPGSETERENFILLQWEDGWKEVIEVDSGCSEINRYYVISRPEDVGRLSLKTESGYPELIEIIRDPLNLNKITFMDTFQIKLERSDREGSKVDHFFALESESDAFSQMLEAFKDVLSEEGMNPKELREKDQDQVRGQYTKIAGKMGLRAAQRQQDLYDFMDYLAKCAM